MHPPPGQRETRRKTKPFLLKYAEKCVEKAHGNERKRPKRKERVRDPPRTGSAFFLGSPFWPLWPQPKKKTTRFGPVSQYCIGTDVGMRTGTRCDPGQKRPLPMSTTPTSRHPYPPRDQHPGTDYAPSSFTGFLHPNTAFAIILQGNRGELDTAVHFAGGGIEIPLKTQT